MINYDLIGRALLHPTAAAILEFLRGTPVAAPSDIAAAIDQPLGNVSYHVKMLVGEATKGSEPKTSPFAETPLIVLDHTEPRRGALKHFYRLSEAARA